MEALAKSTLIEDRGSGVSLATSMMIKEEVLRQHQPPVTLRLVEEMEVVIEHHPPFYCKVGWSVVGNGCGMSSSHCDGCYVAVQQKEPSVNTGRESSHLTTLKVWMQCSSLTNVDTI